MGKVLADVIHGSCICQSVGGREEDGSHASHTWETVKLMGGNSVAFTHFCDAPWEKLPRGHVADLSAALRTAVGLLTAVVKLA